MKVLIVEDEPLLALHLSHEIEELGHEVCAVARYEGEAVEKGAHHKPNLALMDIQLANGTSGIAAAWKLYQLHGIRSIFVSGNLDPATRGQLGAIEPLGFVDKPIQLPLLKRALEQAGRETCGGGPDREGRGRRI